MTGRISRLNPITQTGAIKSENGALIAFELAAVLEYDIQCLAVGQQVSFDLVDGHLPRAVHINVLRRQTDPADRKIPDIAPLRYIGFEQVKTGRIFRFETTSPDRRITFGILMNMDLFARHRVGLQEGPALCHHVAMECLESAVRSGRVAVERSVADQDMIAHLGRKPAPRMRPHGNRFPRRASATSAG